MNHRQDEDDEALSAFIDGELEGDAMLRFRYRLAVSPDLVERVDRHRGDMALIASVYGPLIDRPLPARTVDRIRRPPSGPRLGRSALLVRGLAAAAAGLALVATLWSWSGRVETGPADPLVAEAMAVRGGAVQPEQIVARATLEQAVLRDRFVAATLGQAIKVPDLTRAGYSLTGIAVYPDLPDRHALLLSYRNGGGGIFAVYLRHPVGPDRFDLLRQGNTQLCIWQTDDLGVVMSGEMSAKDMLKVASLTYADLNL